MHISRRQLLRASSAAALASAVAPTLTAGRARAGWEPTTRYPDPAVKILDPSFAKYRIANAGVERLATGMRWCEGPVWIGDGRYLLWSDIPNNRIMRWDESTGAVSEFRKPSNFANGNTRDRQGRLLTCEHLGRRVTRTEYDGRISLLAGQFEGKPLNSPNDIVCKSDGSIWFTDPPFGILHHYEGQAAKPGAAHQPLPDRSAHREAGGDGRRPQAAQRPVLLARRIEAVRRRKRGHPAADPRLRRGRAAAPSWANKRLFLDCGPGTVDGFRCDTDGNLWCGWGMGSDELDGVMVFNPAGKPIGRIQLPERCANLCFGGLARNRLFMAASQSVYSLYVAAQGAPGG